MDKTVEENLKFEKKYLRVSILHIVHKRIGVYDICAIDMTSIDCINLSVKVFEVVLFF